jgi:hypothetical protein
MSTSPIVYITIGYLLCKNYSTQIEAGIALIAKEIKEAINKK